MRNYPTDSPEAAARIVALAMLADGHLCQRELLALERHTAFDQLGLSAGAVHGVLHGLCNDLLGTAELHWSGSSGLDEHALAQLLTEVQDPALRETVLSLCVAVVEADAQVTDGEALVLVRAVEHWGLQRQMLG